MVEEHERAHSLVGKRRRGWCGGRLFPRCYFKRLLLLVFNNLCGKTKIGNGFLEFHALWELWPAMFFNGFFYFIIVIMIFFLAALSSLYLFCAI